MIVTKTSLDKLLLLESNLYKDKRGIFHKTYHEGLFLKFGLCTSWKEEFYTISKKDVIRGMHFQLPPYDHEKIVYCVKGEVTDVILDLRLNSKTYGKVESLNLKGNDGKAIYIPKGFAHGFLSKEDDTVIAYKVSSVYSHLSDTGILWDSFGFDWEIELPTLSDRDLNHLPFSKFISTFK